MKITKAEYNALGDEMEEVDRLMQEFESLEKRAAEVFPEIKSSELRVNKLVALLKKKKKKVAPNKAIFDTKDKDLRDYSFEHPKWLSLFETEDKKGFVPTILIEDSSPCYFYGRPRRDEKGNLPTLERIFYVQNCAFQVSVFPARIKVDGEYKEYYLGEKEELLLDTLRKMIIDNQATLLDGKLGVIFKLSDILNKLKSVNSSASYKEIKLSLIKLRRTSIVIFRSDSPDDPLLDESIITGLRFSSGKVKSAYVLFNSLTLDSLKDGNYRLFDYQAVCSYKNIVSRKIHKRISQFCTQFGLGCSYHFKLSSFFQNSGLSVNKKIANSIKQVEIALNEMKEKEVISDYSLDKVLEGRKIVDVKFTLNATPKFGRHMAKINRLLK